MADQVHGPLHNALAWLGGISGLFVSFSLIEDPDNNPLWVIPFCILVGAGFGIVVANALSIAFKIIIGLLLVAFNIYRVLSFFQGLN